MLLDQPLREWQEDAATFSEALPEIHAYYQSPAGSGKTRAMVNIGEACTQPGTRILIVALTNIVTQHREVLLSLGFQPTENAKEFISPAGNKWIVTTWQAVARNPKKYTKEPCAYLFLDEAHLGCSKADNVSIRRVIKEVPHHRRAAFSATISTIAEAIWGRREGHTYVYRMDTAYEAGILHDVNIIEVETGLKVDVAKVKKIEEIFGKPFEEIEEMEANTLALLATKIVNSKTPLVMPSRTPNPATPVEVVAVATARNIIRNKHACLISIYMAKHRNEQAIFFCPNIGVADWACETFNKRRRGSARAVHIHNPTRADDIAAFKAGTLRALFVVGMLQEGFNMPSLALAFDCHYHRTPNKFRMARMLHRLGRLQRLDPDNPNKPVGQFYVGSDLTHYLPPNYNYGKWGPHSPLATRLLAAGNGLFAADEQVEVMPSVGEESEIEIEGEVDEDDEGIAEPRERRARTIKTLTTPFYVIRNVRGHKTVRSAPLRSLSDIGQSSRDADGNKQKLREMAAAGAPRPKQSTALGRALSNYASPSSKVYDAEFRAYIVAVAPIWILPSTLLEILALPPGSPLPSSRTRLGKALERLTTKSTRNLSARYEPMIMTHHPKWIILLKNRRARVPANCRASTNPKRAALLALPINSLELKPGTDLYKALRVYTSKKHNGYKPEFDAEIRARQPQCFDYSRYAKK